MRSAFLAIVAFAAIANAQTTTGTPTRSITAVGNATVPAAPDKALLDIGVTTQAATAQDASTQNATQVSSVIAALQFILGASATIKTVNYSITPVYNNPSAGQNPSITGYSASNIVEATITDLTLIGKAIDAAIAAGANRVQGIQFGLQNPDPVQAQALKTAAVSALSQASAIAAGLGVHTGSVIRASEGVNVTTPIVALTPTGATASTPVEPGLIQVQASVTIVVEITP